MAQAQMRMNAHAAASGQANVYARPYALTGNRKRLLGAVTKADLDSAVRAKKLKADDLRALVAVRKHADVCKSSGYSEPMAPLKQSKSLSVPLTEQAAPLLQKPACMKVPQALPATPASNRAG